MERYLTLFSNKNIAQLEREIGLAHRTIARWVAGAKPSCDALIKCAEYFGVSIDYLVGHIPRTTVTTFSPAEWYKGFMGCYPSYDTLIKCADYFGVSIDYLVGRETGANIGKPKTSYPPDLQKIIDSWAHLTEKEKTLFAQQLDILTAKKDGAKRKNSG